MKGIIYNASGKILRVVDSPKEMLMMQKMDGEFILFSDGNDEKQYVNQGEVTPRPTQLTVIDKSTINADGVDLVTISNAPNGLFAAINLDTGDNVSGEINGTDTFFTTIPGRYKLKIESFPYLDWEAEINAV